MNTENTFGTPDLSGSPATWQTPRKKRGGCGCLTAFLVFVGAAVIIGIIAVAIAAGAAGDGVGKMSKQHRAASGKPAFDIENFGEDELPDLSEIWSSGGGTTRVVRIPLTGMISFERGAPLHGGGGDTETTLRSIHRATLDDSVMGIILDVDSGGGGITASDIIYDALVKFREAVPGRVVVAHFGDIAASGAYYVSLAANYIMAQPTTLTGSIGVIMQDINVHALAEKLGIEDTSIKSGANKDLMNPLREISPEQQALLQEVVDQLYGRFVGLVAENRDIPEEKVREFADGRVFLADKALSYGLIDGVGYDYDAIAKTAELLGEEDLEVIRYEENLSFWDIFGNKRRFPFGMDAVRRFFGAADSPTLLYRWDIR